MVTLFTRQRPVVTAVRESVPGVIRSTTAVAVKGSHPLGIMHAYLSRGRVHSLLGPRGLSSTRKWVPRMDCWSS